MNLNPAYPHEAPPSGPPARLAAGLQAFVPVLTTARLTLRAPVIGDFPTYGEILMSPRFPGENNRAEAWHDFANYVASWMLRGTGIWAVETRPDATLVGFVLVGMEPGDRECELGWMLTEAGEGHGYATEAARAARDHAAGLGLDALVSYIDIENPASSRVARRLGATRDRAAENALEDTCQVWRHLPEVQA